VKPSKLKVKVSRSGIVESIMLAGEDLIEKYQIVSATYSMLPDRLPTLNLEIFCDEFEHDGPLNVELDEVS